MVLHAAGALGGDILVQVPAQHHIEQLDAPADAQHGLAGLQDQGEEGLLHAVPLGHQGPQFLRGFLPVEAGGQVVAAGKQEPVEGLGIALQGGGVGGQGQDDRRGTGGLQTLGIAGQHPIALQLFIV